MYYWECLEMVRKVVLVGFVAFFRRGSASQLVFGTLSAPRDFEKAHLARHTQRTHLQRPAPLPMSTDHPAAGGTGMQAGMHAPPRALKLWPRSIPRWTLFFMVVVTKARPFAVDLADSLKSAIDCAVLITLILCIVLKLDLTHEPGGGLRIRIMWVGTISARPPERENDSSPCFH